MTDPTYSALRAHERCVAALLGDPEVTGDLLLVGLWLARAVHLRRPDLTDESGWRTSDIARDLYPLQTTLAATINGERVQGQNTGANLHRVVEVLKADIRRYDWRADQPGPARKQTPCGGPMVRRERCGKPAYTWGLTTDPQTGRRTMVGCCRKHTDWWRMQIRANRKACEQVEVPRPAANAGGRLARHVDIDWPTLWLALDPAWEVPPEVESWARPDLRLIVTAAPTPIPGPTRPRFALIDGRS